MSDLLTKSEIFQKSVLGSNLHALLLDNASTVFSHKLNSNPWTEGSNASLSIHNLSGDVSKMLLTIDLSLHNLSGDVSKMLLTIYLGFEE